MVVPVKPTSDPDINALEESGKLPHVPDKQVVLPFINAPEKSGELSHVSNEQDVYPDINAPVKSGKLLHVPIQQIILSELNAPEESGKQPCVPDKQVVFPDFNAQVKSDKFYRSPEEQVVLPDFNAQVKSGKLNPVPDGQIALQDINAPEESAKLPPVPDDQVVLQDINALEEPSKLNPVPDDHAVLQEGGWGWVVVFSSFMIHFIADSVTYTFGIFYLEFLKHFGESKAATSCVASIMVATTQSMGPFASGLVNQFGYRAVTIAGCLLATFGLVLSTFAPSITFLYFSLGICTGIGLGLMNLPAKVIVACYFERRRAFASGIAACGSGVGTAAIAPLVQWMVYEYGWQGAMLIMAGLVLNCCVFGAAFRIPEETNKKETSQKYHEKIKMDSITTEQQSYIRRSSSCSLRRGSLPRKDIFYIKDLTTDDRSSIYLYEEPVQPLKSSKAARLCCPKVVCDTVRDMMNFKLLGDATFLTYVVSNFVTHLGIDVSYIYAKDRAVGLGIEEIDASYLLTVIGVTNTMARVILGYLSDQTWVNRYWLNLGCLVLCGFATAFSALCHTYFLLALHAAVFGVTSGAYVSLAPVICADLMGLDKLTNAFGLLLLFTGLGSLIGAPISGWLFDLTLSYDAGFGAAGSALALSGFILACMSIHKKRRDSSPTETKL